MILSGMMISESVERGDIRIDPFDPRLLNPASVDLRLGKEVAVYTRNTGDGVLDCKREGTLKVRRFSIENEVEGLELQPGKLYLMHTVERVWTDQFVPVIDGKSSVGRLGVKVHETAGYGDPGFDGQYTLEVTTVYPCRVYPGMRFCQMRFHTMIRTLEEVREPMTRKLYRGNYTGDASLGPVASKVWKQFE